VFRISADSLIVYTQDRVLKWSPMVIFIGIEFLPLPPWRLSQSYELLSSASAIFIPFFKKQTQSSFFHNMSLFCQKKQSKIYRETLFVFWDEAEVKSESQNLTGILRRIHNELHNLFLPWHVRFIKVDETEGNETCTREMCYSIRTEYSTCVNQ